MSAPPAPPKRNYKNRSEGIHALAAAGAGFNVARSMQFSSSKTSLPTQQPTVITEVIPETLSPIAAKNNDQSNILDDEKPEHSLWEVLSTLEGQTADVIIGEDVEIKGDFQYTGLLHLLGRFEGRLLTEGDIYIGPKGVLKANLSNMQHVFINGGHVNGHLSVKNVGIQGKSIVRGNINCQYLETQGAECMLLGKLYVNPQAPETLQYHSERRADTDDKITAEVSVQSRDLGSNADNNNNNSNNLSPAEQARQARLIAKQKRKEAKKLLQEEVEQKKEQQQPQQQHQPLLQPLQLSQQPKPQAVKNEPVGIELASNEATVAEITKNEGENVSPLSSTGVTPREKRKSETEKGEKHHHHHKHKKSTHSSKASRHSSVSSKEEQQPASITEEKSTKEVPAIATSSTTTKDNEEPEMLVSARIGEAEIINSSGNSPSKVTATETLELPKQSEEVEAAAVNNSVEGQAAANLAELSGAWENASEVTDIPTNQNSPRAEPIMLDPSLEQIQEQLRLDNESAQHQPVSSSSVAIKAVVENTETVSQEPIEGSQQEVVSEEVNEPVNTDVEANQEASNTDENVQQENVDGQ